MSRQGSSFCLARSSHNLLAGHARSRHFLISEEILESRSSKGQSQSLPAPAEGERLEAEARGPFPSPLAATGVESLKRSRNLRCVPKNPRFSPGVDKDYRLGL